MIVVIIESNFSPGNHFGMSSQSLHLGVRMIRGQSRLVRMNPDRRVYKRIFFGQPNPGVEFRRTIPVANGDHSCDPSFLGTHDHLLPVGVKLLAIEVCVRIDEHVVLCGDSRPRLSVERSSALPLVATSVLPPAEHLPRS